MIALFCVFKATDEMYIHILTIKTKSYLSKSVLDNVHSYTFSSLEFSNNMDAFCMFCDVIVETGICR